MKLVVTLGASAEASFDIHLYDTKFVSKYVGELIWCLQHCEFNQHEAFATLYSLNYSKKCLRDSCLVINKYLKDFIDIQDISSQEYYNYLHVKFEQLSGEFGKPTRLFNIANKELKQAIRDLNFFVHRVELNKETHPALYISFDKDQYRRHPLSIEDYNEFEFKFPAGTLFLHYVELGKEYIDLYEDNLSIDYTGAKNLHYYSGESMLTFDEFDCFADNDYVTWFERNNIDRFNKTLGHGKIPLGYIEDKDAVSQLLDRYRFLKSIEVKYE
jgi:hypothetical protein